MSTNKKVLTSALLMQEHEQLFACPLCSSQMKVMQLKSLVCSNRHCFDISKQGYVNLLPHPPRNKYEKRMFESRRKISDLDCFEPLTSRIADLLSAQMKSVLENVYVLDAGCGEGSHLSDILRKADSQQKKNVVGVGIDIAKEGIQIAAKENDVSSSVWCVADLAKSPFANGQFHTILNILSPSNYAEFQRMLAKSGRVIKVIPESRYLEQLREVFYRQTDKQVYSNDLTQELFSRHFELVDTEHVQYTVAVKQEYILPLILMTPLSWGASVELIEQVMDMNIVEMTFDFRILVGRSQ